MNDFQRLVDEGALDWVARAAAAVPAIAEGTCRYCGKPIVFKPRWLDGKQPNPPVWLHPAAGITCSTRPTGWSTDSWPIAEPATATHAIRAVTLINLTPHPMHVYSLDTPDQIDPPLHRPIRVYPPSTMLARRGGVELDRWLLGDELVVEVEYAGSTGLPPYAGDMDSRDREVWYITSLVTALGARPRGDLLVPHAAVRDLNGRVVGCRMFGRPTGSKPEADRPAAGDGRS